jgi:endonuclease G
VIAVDIPNTQGVRTASWGSYRVSVDVIEQRTGFDIMSLVPASIQSTIEARVDNGPLQ